VSQEEQKRIRMPGTYMPGGFLMKHRELISVALRFNEMINSWDLIGLSVLMTEDHTFIDISNRVHKGRDSMIVG